MTTLDALLDRTTMYRLALYVLLGLIAVATILASVGLLPFSPLALLLSAGFLALMCWAANTLLATFLNVSANVESSIITALILALLLDPARSPDDLPFLGWTALLAMASKYVLAPRDRHIFNPAAIAVVITSVALGESASWWVGTASMLPFVLLGGALLVRKVRQLEMIAAFLLAALATLCVVSVVQRIALPSELRLLIVESPLVFFAAVMLTEPLTAPPTRRLKWIYGGLAGMLIIPQIHLGSLYSTPELALVTANIFSFAVSPQGRVVFTLRRKSRIGSNIVEFAFTPSRRPDFLPGQYMEWTLAHPHPDNRGNRRYFTLASSPTEETIRLGVRFYERGSSFKRAMHAMSPRAKLSGTRIAGDFTLPRDSRRKLVFIAGGIGITPYRSMLKYLLDTKQRRDIVVLYANRSVDEIVYKDVLSDAQVQLGAKVVYTLTDVSTIPPSWTGKRGRVTGNLLSEVVPDYAERWFYLSGPPEMVRDCERTLREIGIHRSRINTDFFPGLV
jgi:glycine betaine catabolism B